MWSIIVEFDPAEAFLADPEQQAVGDFDRLVVGVDLEFVLAQLGAALLNGPAGVAGGGAEAGELEEFVKKALADNPKSVADYRGGKAVALKYLVGQVMRLSRGRANPQMVQELLKKKLEK